MARELTTINRLFLELSQFTTAKTKTELALEAEIKRLKLSFVQRGDFEQQVGNISLDVFHKVGGRDVEERELLRSATEHETAYPCEVKMSPMDLKNSIMRAYDRARHWPSEEDEGS